MDLAARLNEQRETVLKVAAKHGARNVRVFGSVARQDAIQRDIDLLVDLEKGRSLLDHVRLKNELEQVLGCRVDVLSERGLKPRIRERVLKEATPI